MFLGFLGTLSIWGCASKKRTDIPDLSEYSGKRVALIEIDGPSSSKAMVEVALVNQLVERGTFILISKREIERARAKASVNARDWKALSQAVEADLALKAQVLEFDAEESEGYNEEEVYDSQMAEERGKKEGTVKRLYKVKRLIGKVKIGLQFFRVNSGSVQSATVEESETLERDERKKSIHFPPRLRFMEELVNRAFQKFFDDFN